MSNPYTEILNQIIKALIPKLNGELGAEIREQGLDLPDDEKVNKIREKQECELVAEVRRHHAHAKRQNSSPPSTGETTSDTASS